MGEKGGGEGEGCVFHQKWVAVAEKVWRGKRGKET